MSPIAYADAVDCPDCGKEFTTEYNEVGRWDGIEDGELVSGPVCACPNCEAHMHLER